MRNLLGAVGLCVGALAPREACAQTDGSPTRMRLAMHSYFGGEKRESLLFAGAGLTAGGVAEASLTDPRLEGLAYPLAGVGFFQLLVGTILYLRTDGQVARLDASLSADPQGFRDAETRRMRRVVWQFQALEVVEVVCAVAGTVMATYGALSDDALWRNVGLGIALQGAGTFALDVAAHRRANEYLHALQAFRVSPVAGGAVAGYGLRF